jgi:hypothetical protein
MKVAITGHTSGIGNSLTGVFPDFIGFSRKNGYDLHNISIRGKMYTEIEDCDIFINNADLGWNQTKLLYELWDRWKDKDKLIVNIGSTAADYNQPIARPYNIQKRALQDACLQLQQAQQSCKVMLVKPGYVDTPRVQQINATKMDPGEVALYIKDLIEMKNSTFWVPIVTLYPR